MSVVSCSTTSTTAYKVTADTTGTLVLQTGSTPTTAVTIDGSQNVGVGVTPSAWYSTYKAIETGSGSLVYAGAATNTQLWNNLYVNTSGNTTYKTTGIGGLYSIGGGGNAHTWYYAASGTAGTTATLTQAMTLDASGNLLVGTTSAAPNTISSTYVQTRIGTVGNLYSGFSNTFGFVLTANSYQYTGGTNRRLVSGYTSRLDLRSDDGTITTATATTGAADTNITFTSGPYIANLGTSWTNASDERLKNITGEIQNGLAKVCTLRAAEYTWKEGENKKPQVGLIAQDLLKVLPEVVVVPATETDEDGNQKYLGVNYDQVIPLLVAAIKEQQALITQLQADVAALKGE